ncbi:molybdenum-dependent transcriptional regulator [Pragia fontium]|uniref:Transcriptional regulator ModE n=1 Tax=Pragia fontium TaxID=82985 RepID=A0ABQ5LGR0_9GAMM|nr:molybdenum-dependent transcriptional regulator [Pragia fontium]AKJ41948.1 transcriptional regulator [Pragia fontium]GKX62032.1 transcriptional regulator ModE [Pragia fontium]VEJ54864.1 Transcriptional regulator modE [Pragia fontium]
MNAEILLTLKLQGNLFADPRRIALLKQIAHTGSISQGAKLAGISYKSAWDAVNEMNQLTEHLLVERATGGKGGGGAHLTTYGQRLIQLYDLLEKIQQKAFDVLQDDTMPLDSLLGAIARFSLQTSARNQFFGTIDTQHKTTLPECITLLMADGKTRINASLTQQSIERLQLTDGKEILALIKAPLIDLHTKPVVESDNCLSGVVISVTRSEHRSEILLKLDDGETLCSTISNQQADRISPVAGQQLWATFSAESVIIATLC